MRLVVVDVEVPDADASAVGLVILARITASAAVLLTSVVVVGEVN